ncbi:hypothetical protein Emed_007328 [Eimeria media]
MSKVSGYSVDTPGDPPRRQLDVGRSCKGVILTCNRQPLEACNEFLNILERFLEDTGAASSSSPVSKDEDEPCVADDVAAGISAELQSITGRAKRFQVYNQLLPVRLRLLKENDGANKEYQSLSSELRSSDSRARRTCPRSCATACCAASSTTQDSTPAGCCSSSSSSSSSDVDCISIKSSLASLCLCPKLIEPVHVTAVCMHPCRHASRLLPVDVCASPSLPDFVAAARRLCAQALPLSAVALGLEPAASAEAAAEGKEAAEASAAKPEETQQASSLPEKGTANSAETETCASEAPSAGKSSSSSSNTSSNSTNTSSNSSSNSSSNNSSNSSSSSEGSAVDEGSKETWACAFSSRGFGTVKKEQVVEALAALVGKNYKVDITHARHTLLVEVNPYFFGVSVVPDYGAFYRYNLHRCCHPEEEKEKEKQAKKPQTLTAPDEGSTDPNPKP